jgi:hypothetical protein
VESQVINNNPDLSVIFATSLRTFLASIIIIPNVGFPTQSISLENVIVGRTLNAQGVYEIDLARVNFVESITIKQYVTTQNSRKP